MVDDPERERLDDLSARIHAAEGKAAPPPAESSAAPLKASNAGYEMVGTIIACLVVGWLIDRYLHTKPWGIMGMLLVGVVAAGMNIWRALNGYDQSVGLHKKNGKQE